MTRDEMFLLIKDAVDEFSRAADVAATTIEGDPDDFYGDDGKFKELRELWFEVCGVLDAARDLEDMVAAVASELGITDPAD
jgi:hypothetical protein